MNGVHDMGGMHGFGPVLPDANEPVFHADWEGRVLALMLSMSAWRRWNIDAMRHAIERSPPAQYLNDSYWERWFAALKLLSVETGLVTSAEIDSGRMAAGSDRQTPPMTPEVARKALTTSSYAQRPTSVAPRFATGDLVRTKNLHPTGHTRLPRYVRGRTGVVLRDHGAHVFADSNALLQGENAQPLYTVQFTAQELWGDGAPAADTVSLNLWEAYLERP